MNLQKTRVGIDSLFFQLTLQVCEFFTFAQNQERGNVNTSQYKDHSKIEENVAGATICRPYYEVVDRVPDKVQEKIRACIYTNASTTIFEIARESIAKHINFELAVAEGLQVDAGLVVQSQGLRPETVL